MTVNAAFITGFAVSYNSACKCTGYLAEQNILAMLSPDHYERALVLSACLGLECCIKVSVLMLNIDNGAVNREPSLDRKSVV